MSFEPLEKQVGDILASTYVHFMSITFLYYDHAITLAPEIMYIWRRPKALSSWLFLVNRYLAFFANIVVTVFNQTHLSQESCEGFRLFQQIHFVATEALVAVVMVLRVYALYARDRRMLSFLIFSVVVVVPICIWALLGQKKQVQPENPFVGCTLGLSDETAAHIAVPWEALLVFDTMIICLIIWNSYSRNIRGARTRIPLLWVIVRDGSMYFTVMVVANLANIILLHTGGSFVRGSLTTTTCNFSVMMTSRLMLNLHEYSDVGVYCSAVPQGASVQARFRATRMGTDEIALTELYDIQRNDEQLSLTV